MLLKKLVITKEGKFKLDFKSGCKLLMPFQNAPLGHFVCIDGGYISIKTGYKYERL